MSINFDKALGIHEQALSFRAQRAEVLANNIANADAVYCLSLKCLFALDQYRCWSTFANVQGLILVGKTQ